MQTDASATARFPARILGGSLATGREPWSDYLAHGGYRGLETAQGMSPAEIVGLLETSGLRGRGGAAFPVSRKWQSMLGRELPTYLVVNGEEGEPGSLKDRALMARRPHLVLEGALIACHLIGCREAVMYLSEDFADATESLRTAVDEARAHGILSRGFDQAIEIRFTHVPHSYVAGEETAALQAIEGALAKPRFKPPRPFEAGLFGRPTLVQNVETLGCVALLFQRGAAWHCELGTTESPGTLLISLAGDVERPGVYEIPFGTTLREAIDDLGGGVAGGAKVRAVLPGGYFSGFCPPSILDLPYTYDVMAAAGGAIGSANVTVLSEEGCALRKARAVTEFFALESCKQCGPCFNGTSMIDKLLQQVLKGKGKRDYIERIGFLAGHVRRHGACGHLDGAAAVASTLLGVFAEEITRHLEGSCGPCGIQR